MCAVAPITLKYSSYWLYQLSCTAETVHGSCTNSSAEHVSH